ncbi:MAG: hypothetical protein JWP63_3774, partial [Candidatus Solibacter sp.]|nr:hypothetical protein [Candidatus Solibacter sp.]
LYFSAHDEVGADRRGRDGCMGRSDGDPAAASATETAPANTALQTGERRGRIERRERRRRDGRHGRPQRLGDGGRNFKRVDQADLADADANVVGGVFTFDDGSTIPGDALTPTGAARRVVPHRPHAGRAGMSRGGHGDRNAGALASGRSPTPSHWSRSTSHRNG